MKLIAELNGSDLLALSSHESQLPDRLKAGTDSAWTEFFDAYGPRVWAYLARLLGANREAVADAVQETFFAAARGIQSFDTERGTLVRWLMGIAHRQAAQHWRKHGIRESVSLTGPEGLAELPDADIQLEQMEITAAVRRVLASLPEEMAELLIAKYVEDQTSIQQAERLGISEEAIRSRLMRARDRFRAAFAARHRELIEAE